MAVSSSSSKIPDPNYSENPFVHYVHLRTRDYCKLFIMSIFVAPIRLFLIAVFFVLAYLVASVSLIVEPIESQEETKPFTLWRKKTRDITAKLLLIAHFFAGFHRIKFKGRRAQPWEAPLLIAAPHSSFLDTLPVVALGAPSLVGKSSLINYPMFGKIIQLTQPITVTRECKDSRRVTIEKIEERSRLIQEERDSDIPDGRSWAQILVFTEGTCTNRSQLLTFKPGAFYPGLPVQPVCFHWSKNPDFTSWTWEGAGALKLLWLNVCQWQNELEIEFLPVYRPSVMEQKDARLFAENVRSAMGRKLQIAGSDLAWEDMASVSANGHLRMSRFLETCKKLGLEESNRSAEDLDRVWSALSNSQYAEKGYMVSLQEFAEYIGLRNAEFSYEALLRLFVMFDWNLKKKMDLREYIIVKYGTGRHTDFLHNSFKILDAESTTDSAMEEVWIKILRIPFELSRYQIKKMCNATLTQFGDLSFDSFMAFLSSSETYAHILGMESFRGFG